MDNIFGGSIGFMSFSFACNSEKISKASLCQWQPATNCDRPCSRPAMLTCNEDKVSPILLNGLVGCQVFTCKLGQPVHTSDHCTAMLGILFERYLDMLVHVKAALTMTWLHKLEERRQQGNAGCCMHEAE